MAYYNNARVHYDGSLILYQRDLKTAAPKSPNHRTPNWYMKIDLPELEKPINRSTKCVKYEDAYEVAKKEYRRIEVALQQGHSLKDYTFDQHWDDWYDRGQKQGRWRSDRERWHRSYADRYFKPFFRRDDGTSMRLNDITALVADRYWEWRIDFWQRAQGEKLKKSNPKRRGAKTTTTNNAKNTPAPKTLSMEQTALNEIFRDARDRGRTSHNFKMKSPLKDDEDRRRPHFDSNEYGQLTNYIHSYKECIGVFKGDSVNAWHKLHRVQLYHFVLFMLNSGLRPGEAYKMRWQDVQFGQHDPASGEDIAVVTVRKDTKKRQNRDVQTQPTANRTLQEWRAASPHTKPDDFVWFGQEKDANGNPLPVKDLSPTFKSFLKRIPVPSRTDGMLRNKEGEPRVVYSLRHTYATQRVEKGNVSYADLALNMGCEIKQIEKHYSHADSHLRRSEIVKTKAKSGAKADDTTATAGLSPLVLEAMKSFDAGEIDEAMMINIMKAAKAKRAQQSA